MYKCVQRRRRFRIIYIIFHYGRKMPFFIKKKNKKFSFINNSFKYVKMMKMMDIFVRLCIYFSFGYKPYIHHKENLHRFSFISHFHIFRFYSISFFFGLPSFKFKQDNDENAI